MVIAYTGGKFTQEFVSNSGDFVSCHFACGGRFLVLLDKKGTLTVKDLDSGAARTMLELGKTCLYEEFDPLTIIGDCALFLRDFNLDNSGTIVTLNNTPPNDSLMRKTISGTKIGYTK
jgi:hypothetical protein